jgi:hypothetical protein
MADPGCRAATCGELKAGGDKGERRDASEDVSRRCWRERERRISERSTAGRAKFLKFFSFFSKKVFLVKNLTVPARRRRVSSTHRHREEDSACASLTVSVTVPSPATSTATDRAPRAPRSRQIRFFPLSVRRRGGGAGRRRRRASASARVSAR